MNASLPCTQTSPFAVRQAAIAAGLGPVLDIVELLTEPRANLVLQALVRNDDAALCEAISRMGYRTVSGFPLALKLPALLTHFPGAEVVLETGRTNEGRRWAQNVQESIWKRGRLAEASDSALMAPIPHVRQLRSVLRRALAAFQAKKALPPRVDEVALPAWVERVQEVCSSSSSTFCILSGPQGLADIQASQNLHSAQALSQALQTQPARVGTYDWAFLFDFVAGVQILITAARALLVLCLVTLYWRVRIENRTASSETSGSALPLHAAGLLSIAVVIGHIYPYALVQTCLAAAMAAVAQIRAHSRWVILAGIGSFVALAMLVRVSL